MPARFFLDYDIYMTLPEKKATSGRKKIAITQAVTHNGNGQAIDMNE
jgi:hypothetical protein